MKKHFLLTVSCIFLSIIILSGCAADSTEQHRRFSTIEHDTSENLMLLSADRLFMPPALTEIKASNNTLVLEKGASAKLSYELLPTDAWNKSLTFSSDNESIASVDENGNVTANASGSCTITAASVEISSVTAEFSVTVKAPVIIPPPAENTAVPSESEKPSGPAEPTYINGILIANKTYALPSDYNPGVNGEAYSALMNMFNDAKAQGYGFWVASGFRSYSHQSRTYNNYVAMDGQAAADRYSARPGHSEHQTGLAFDLNYLTQAFGQSAEGIWLKENCHKYGFIIRYPEGKESVTGYMYEPWHVRYLGVETATAVYESGLCLEEYLGITSVYAEQ